MATELSDDEWRELIARAYDDRRRSRRNGHRRAVAERDRRSYGEDATRRPITLPRLKFLEKPFDDEA